MNYGISASVGVLLLAMLAVYDPKRRRSASKLAPRSARRSLGSWRMLLGWLTVSPAVAFMATGRSWNLLVWAGATCVGGWLIPQILAWRAPRRAPVSGSDTPR